MVRCVVEEQSDGGGVGVGDSKRERERENGGNKEERQKNGEILLQFLPEADSCDNA